MDAREVALLGELRALQFTVDKITLSLKQLNALTAEGGELCDNQRKMAEALSLWATLFKAGRLAADGAE